MTINEMIEQLEKIREHGKGDADIYTAFQAEDVNNDLFVEYMYRTGTVHQEIEPNASITTLAGIGTVFVIY